MFKEGDNSNQIKIDTFELNSAYLYNIDENNTQVQLSKQSNLKLFRDFNNTQEYIRFLTGVSALDENNTCYKLVGEDGLINQDVIVESNESDITACLETYFSKIDYSDLSEIKIEQKNARFSYATTAYDIATYLPEDGSLNTGDYEKAAQSVIESTMEIKENINCTASNMTFDINTEDDSLYSHKVECNTKLLSAISFNGFIDQDDFKHNKDFNMSLVEINNNFDNYDEVSLLYAFDSDKNSTIRKVIEVLEKGEVLIMDIVGVDSIRYGEPINIYSKLFDNSIDEAYEEKILESKEVCVSAYFIDEEMNKKIEETIDRYKELIKKVSNDVNIIANLFTKSGTGSSNWLIKGSPLLDETATGFRTTFNDKITRKWKLHISLDKIKVTWEPVIGSGEVHYWHNNLKSVKDVMREYFEGEGLEYKDLIDGYSIKSVDNEAIVPSAYDIVPTSSEFSSPSTLVAVSETTKLYFTKYLRYTYRSKNYLAGLLSKVVADQYSKFLENVIGLIDKESMGSCLNDISNNGMHLVKNRLFNFKKAMQNPALLFPSSISDTSIKNKVAGEVSSEYKDETRIMSATISNKGLSSSEILGFCSNIFDVYSYNKNNFFAGVLGTEKVLTEIKEDSTGTSYLEYKRFYDSLDYGDYSEMPNPFQEKVCKNKFTVMQTQKNKKVCSDGNGGTFLSNPADNFSCVRDHNEYSHIVNLEGEPKCNLFEWIFFMSKCRSKIVEYYNNLIYEPKLVCNYTYSNNGRSSFYAVPPGLVSGQNALMYEADVVIENNDVDRNNITLLVANDTRREGFKFLFPVIDIGDQLTNSLTGTDRTLSTIDAMVSARPEFVYDFTTEIEDIVDDCVKFKTVYEIEKINGPQDGYAFFSDKNTRKNYINQDKDFVFQIKGANGNTLNKSVRECHEIIGSEQDNSVFVQEKEYDKSDVINFLISERDSVKDIYDNGIDIESNKGEVINTVMTAVSENANKTYYQSYVDEDTGLVKKEYTSEMDSGNTVLLNNDEVESAYAFMNPDSEAVKSIDDGVRKTELATTATAIASAWVPGLIWVEVSIIATNLYDILINGMKVLTPRDVVTEDVVGDVDNITINSVNKEIETCQDLMDNGETQAATVCYRNAAQAINSANNLDTAINDVSSDVARKAQAENMSYASDNHESAYQAAVARMAEDEVVTNIHSRGFIDAVDECYNKTIYTTAKDRENCIDNMQNNLTTDDKKFHTNNVDKTISGMTDGGSDARMNESYDNVNSNSANFFNGLESEDSNGSYDKYINNMTKGILQNVE